MRALLLLLVVAWSTACTVSPADYAGRACDDDHPCLDGRVCVANVCVDPDNTSPCSDAPLGEACVAGQGVCASSGTWTCTAGVATCVSDTAGSPEAETCDGLDNDCNGIVDDVSGCMHTLVGANGPVGFRDGTGSEARVAMPSYLTADAAGNLFLADRGNNAIRHISPAGVMTTIAGGGHCGFADGPVDTARFCEPIEVVEAEDGVLYVSDSGNHRIRRIHEGQVTTVAGTGIQGHVNGPALDARLDDPKGLFLRADGSLLIADSGNGAIRRFIPGPSPQLETIAGAGWGTREGDRATVQFNGVGDVAEDGLGTLYVSDVYASRIRRLPPVGMSTTFAGKLWSSGYENGMGGSIRMTEPTQLTFDEESQTLYFADRWNYEIRAVPLAGPSSFTVGGSRSYGYASGFFADSEGQSVHGFARVGQDYFFSDLNQAIRRNTVAIRTLTTVEFVAGTLNAFTLDGPATEARLRQPRSLIRGEDGTLYWVDFTAHLVRKLTPEGEVVTLVGQIGEPNEGIEVGPFSTARISWPGGLALTPDGTLYLAEFGNSTVRKLDLETEQLTPFAGSLDGTWGHVDGALAESSFDGPRGLAYGRDASGQEVLYVGDTYNRVLRKIVLPEGPVSTIAGVSGLRDRQDGPLGVGTFGGLGPVAADLQGNVWVVDDGSIRHLSPNGVLTTAYDGLPMHVESVVLDGDSLVASGEGVIARMDALPPDSDSVEVIFRSRFGWQDGVSGEAGGRDFESIVVTPEAFYVADYLTGQIRQLWR